MKNIIGKQIKEVREKLGITQEQLAIKLEMAGWSASAKHYKFYLIMHEHLFIFRKPDVGESLSRIQYSTWKGLQKAQAIEDEEDWKGLLDWENKKPKSKK